MINRQKSYGENYNKTKIKYKLNKVKLLKLLILFLIITEIIIGVLWAIGK